MVANKTKNRSNPSAVSFNAKILGFSAGIHVFLICILYFLLAGILLLALAYNYAKFPETIFGQPAPPEMVEQMKSKVLLIGLAGTGSVPFLVLLLATIVLVFVRHKLVYTISFLFTITLAFIFIVYNGAVIFYFESKFIWPPMILMEILKAPKMDPPTPRELIEWPIFYFCKVFVTALTACMCAVVVIQAYCAMVLLNLSIFYQPPVDLYAVKVMRNRRKMEENEEEEEEEEESDREEGLEDETKGAGHYGSKMDWLRAVIKLKRELFHARGPPVVPFIAVGISTNLMGITRYILQK